MFLLSYAVCQLCGRVRYVLYLEACQAVAGHDSFLGDADPFAQPELSSLIASAEGVDTKIIVNYYRVA